MRNDQSNIFVCCFFKPILVATKCAAAVRTRLGGRQSRPESGPARPPGVPAASGRRRHRRLPQPGAERRPGVAGRERLQRQLVQRRPNVQRPSRPKVKR